MFLSRIFSIGYFDLFSMGFFRMFYTAVCLLCVHVKTSLLLSHVSNYLSDSLLPHVFNLS